MYNTWKQMIQYSDEKGCMIEEIPELLLQNAAANPNLKIPTSMARKIDSMSIPKQLCVYK
jgi:hypothetical protein